MLQLPLEVATFFSFLSQLYYCLPPVVQGVAWFSFWALVVISILKSV